MHTYIRTKSASKLKRRHSGIKVPADRVEVIPEPKQVAARSPESPTYVAFWLTLDDFGGRSDALGG
jgi:hypothetical protein